MLRVENLTKIFYGYSKAWKRIPTVLSFGFYKGDLKFKALENVSFEVKEGEILGIIGRNGAGKSTLLKILSGVTNFESGKIIKQGTLRALIELGVGFNPELTGAENIFYNALLWGYTKQQIQNKIDALFEFAGLTEFKNYPLKTYSSGMNVRLGFALATMERPDILLIDEALSVGDASFQQKSIRKVQEFVRQGTKVILVSHDLHLISYICNRVLVLEKGKVFTIAQPKEALEKYMEILGSLESNSFEFSNQLIQYIIYTETETGVKKTHFFIDEIIVLKIKFKLKEYVPDLTVGFHIEDRRGVRVFGTNSHILRAKMNFKPSLEFECSFRFPVRFCAGSYSVSFSIHKGENHTEGCLIWKENILEIEIEQGNVSKFEGLVYIPATCEWN